MDNNLEQEITNNIVPDEIVAELGLEKDSPQFQPEEGQLVVPDKTLEEVKKIGGTPDFSYRERKSQYDVGYTPAEGDRQYYRGRNQPWYDQMGNALAGGIGMGVLTALEDASYILDFENHVNWIRGVEDMERNAFAEMMKEGKEDIQKNLAIYRERPGGLVDFGDSAFYWESFRGLLDSAVGFGAVGLGAATAVKAISKAARIGAWLQKMIPMAESAAKAVGMEARVGSAIAKAEAFGARALQFTAAAITNYGESKMMALELYEDALQEQLDQKVPRDIAIKNATDQANDFMLRNRVFIATDALALAGLARGMNSTRRTARDLSAKSFIKSFGEVSTKNPIVQAFGEAGEEIGQNVLQEEGKYQALKAADKTPDDVPSDTMGRIIQYATSEQALLEGAMGFFGGPIQYAIIQGPQDLANKKGIQKDFATQRAQEQANQDFVNGELKKFVGVQRAINEGRIKGDQFRTEQLENTVLGTIAFRNFEAGTTDHLERTIQEKIDTAETQAEKDAYKSQLNKIRQMEEEYIKMKYIYPNEEFRPFYADIFEAQQDLKLSREHLNRVSAQVETKKAEVLDAINKKRSKPLDSMAAELATIEKEKDSLEQMVLTLEATRDSIVEQNKLVSEEQDKGLEQGARKKTPTNKISTIINRNRARLEELNKRIAEIEKYSQETKQEIRSVELDQYTKDEELSKLLQRKAEIQEVQTEAEETLAALTDLEEVKKISEERKKILQTKLKELLDKANEKKETEKRQDEEGDKTPDDKKGKKKEEPVVVKREGEVVTEDTPKKVEKKTDEEKKKQPKEEKTPEEERKTPEEKKAEKIDTKEEKGQSVDVGDLVTKTTLEQAAEDLKDVEDQVVDENAEESLEEEEPGTKQTRLRRLKKILYSFNAIAYLTREYKVSMDVLTDGTAILVVEDTEDNLASRLREPLLLDPDDFQKGTKLTIEVDTEYRLETKNPDGTTTVETYETLLEKGKKQGKPERVYDYIPLAIKRDGKIVGHVHNVDFPIRRTAEKNIAQDIKDIRNLRNFIMTKGGGKFETEVIEKGLGYLTYTKGYKPRLLKEINPDPKPIVGVSTSRGLFLSDPSIANKLANRKPLKQGVSYMFIKRKDGLYMPVPILNSRLTQPHIDTIANAVSLYFSQDKTSQAVKEIYEKEGIDITTTKGLNEFINKLTGTLRRGDDFLRKKVEERTINDNDENTYIDVKGDGIDATRGGGIGYITTSINKETGKREYYIGYGKGRKQITQADWLSRFKEILGYSYYHMNPKLLKAGSINITTLSENEETGELEANFAPTPYTDFVKETHLSNVMGFALPNGKVAHFQQPVIRFAVPEEVEEQETVPSTVVETTEKKEKAQEKLPNIKVETTRSGAPLLIDEEAEEEMSRKRETKKGPPSEYAVGTSEVVATLKRRRLEGFTARQQEELLNYLALSFYDKLNKGQGKVKLAELEQAAMGELLDLKDRIDNSGLSPESKAKYIETIDSIFKQWNKTRELLIRKVISVTGIKFNAIDAVGEDLEGFNEKVDYEKSSLEIDPRDTISSRLKRFLASIPAMNRAGKYKKLSSLPIGKIMSGDQVFAEVQGALAGLPPNFNKQIARLQERARQKPYFKEVIKKLLEADSQIQKEFASEMAKHSIEMKTALVGSEEVFQDGKPAGTVPFARVISTNRNALAQNLLEDWTSDFVAESRTLNKDGEPYFTKEQRDAAINQYQELSEYMETRPKETDEGFEEAFQTWKEEAVARLDHWLQNFGILMDENALDNLVTEKRLWALFSKENRGAFDILNNNMKTRGDATLYANNFFESGSMKQLAKYNSDFVTDLFARSFFNGENKVIHGYSYNKEFTNTARDLQQDPSLRRRKLSLPFNQDSLWVEELDDENSEIHEVWKPFYVDTLKGARKRRGKAPNKLTATELEVLELTLFANNAQIVNGRRVISVLHPTLSDKKTPVGLTTLGIDTSLSLEGRDISDTTADLLYKYILLPELKRVLEFQDKGDVGIEGFNSGKHLFFFFPELNGDMAKEGFDLPNKMRYVNGKKAGKIKPLATLEKEGVVKEMKEYIKAVIKKEVEEKLKDWEKYGIITRDSKGTIVGYDFIDHKYIDKIAAERRKGTTLHDTIQYAAFDFVTNTMVANAEFFKAFDGDPALYVDKKALAAIKDPDKTSLVAVMHTFNNVGKRLARMIAPGREIANEEDYVEGLLLDAKMDSLNEELIKKMDEEFGEKNNPYRRITSTDGQEYTLFSEAIRILVDTGKISEQQAKDYLVREKAETLTKEEIKDIFSKSVSPLTALKPVYSATIQDDTYKTERAVYIKTSSIPLPRQLTRGLEIDKLRAAMEEGAQLGDRKIPISRVTFSSGIKVGSKTGLRNIWNEDGTINENELVFDSSNTLLLPRSGFRIQEDVVYDRDKAYVNDGTQQRKLLFAGLTKHEDMREKLREYEESYGELWDLRGKMLLREIAVPTKVRVTTKTSWAQTAPRRISYEVSSKGDTRFSATLAKLSDGRTIEEAYQLDIKGYRALGGDAALGKNKEPIIPSYRGLIKPEPNTVFVFGSNPEGRHGAGSAKVAVDQFGAIQGQGEGLQGNSYALPTKDLRVKENNGLRSIPPEQITKSIEKLYEVARQNPTKQFKVAYTNTTERSLNGYTGLEMIQMFNNAGNRPSNIVFSEEWVNTGALGTLALEEQWEEYKGLWRQFLEENPALFEDLIQKVRGKVLTDRFAKTEISQARALSELINEKLERDQMLEQEVDAEFPDLDFAKVRKLLMEEAIKRNYAINDQDLLDLPQEDFLNWIIFSNSTNRIENLLMSIVDHKVRRNKMPGFSNVMVSEEGWRFKKMQTFEDAEGFEAFQDQISESRHNVVFTQGWTGRLLPARPDPSNPNKILPAQVIVPWQFRDAKGKVINMKQFIDPASGKIDMELLPPELLKLFAYRIPTSSHSQMAAVEIVGFSRGDLAGTIIAPRDFVTQMGSDFDVDKLYCFQPHVQVENGRMTKYKHDPDKIRASYSAQEQIQELDEQTEDLLQGNIGVAEKSKKSLDDLIDESRIKEIQNRIIDIHFEVFEDQRAYDIQTEATGYGKLEELAEELEAKFSKQTNFSGISQRYQRQKYLNAARGKDGVSVFALATTTIANLETANALIGDGKDNRIYFFHRELVQEDGKEYWKKIETHVKFKNANSRRLSDPYTNQTRTGKPKRKISVVSRFLQAAVDNEKLQVLDKLNVNEETYTVINAMIGMGFEEDLIVYFINQPIIREYIELVQSKKSALDSHEANAEERARKEIYAKWEIDELLKTVDEDRLEERAKEVSKGILQNMIANDKADRTTQVAMLFRFLKIKEMGMDLRKLATAINIDSKGMPKYLTNSILKEEDIRDLGKLSIRNAEALIGKYQDGTILPTTISGHVAVNGLFVANNLWSQLLPMNNQELLNTFDLLEGITGRGKLTHENRGAWRADVYAAFVRYYLSKVGSRYENVNKLRERLFVDTTSRMSLASIVQNIKDKGLLADNPFFNLLRPAVDKRTGKISLVRLNNSMGAFTDDSSIHAGFSDLLEDPKVLGDFNGEPYTTADLARDLTLYDYLAGDSIAISFSRFIPLAQRMSVVGSLANREDLLATFASDRVPFVTQYMQHNPWEAVELEKDEYTKDGALPNSLKGIDTETTTTINLKGEDIGGVITFPKKFTTRVNGETTLAPFVAIRGGKGRDTYSLYALADRKYGVYVKIPVLGAFGMEEFDSTRVVNESILSGRNEGASNSNSLPYMALEDRRDPGTERERAPEIEDDAPPTTVPSSRNLSVGNLIRSKYKKAKKVLDAIEVVGNTTEHEDLKYLSSLFFTYFKGKNLDGKKFTLKDGEAEGKAPGRTRLGEAFDDEIILYPDEAEAFEKQAGRERLERLIDELPIHEAFHMVGLQNFIADAANDPIVRDIHYLYTIAKEAIGDKKLESGQTFNQVFSYYESLGQEDSEFAVRLISNKGLQKLLSEVKLTEEQLARLEDKSTGDGNLLMELLEKFLKIIAKQLGIKEFSKDTLFYQASMRALKKPLFDNGVITDKSLANENNEEFHYASEFAYSTVTTEEGEQRRLQVAIEDRRIRIREIQATIARIKNFPGNIGRVQELTDRVQQYEDDIKQMLQENALKTLEGIAESDIAILQRLTSKPKMSMEEYYEANRIVNLWKKSLELFFSDSEKEFRNEIVKKFEEIRNAVEFEEVYLRRQASLFTQEFLKQNGVSTDLAKILANMRDVDSIHKEVMDISRFGNPILDVMSKVVADANRQMRVEIDKEDQKILDLVKKMRKSAKAAGLSEQQMWDSFMQERENGELTGNVVFRYTPEFFEERARLKNIHDSAPQGADGQYLRQQYYDWLSENVLVFDTRMLMGVDTIFEGEDAEYNKTGSSFDPDSPEVREHKAKIISIVGEREYERLAESQKKLLEEYKEMYLYAKERIWEDITDQEERDKALDAWVKENSPYWWLQKIKTPKGEKRKEMASFHNVGYRYTIDIASNEKYFDKKFKKMTENQDFLDFYEYYLDTVSKVRGILPAHAREHLGVNGLPFLKKLTSELFHERGFSGAMSGVMDATKNIISGTEMTNVVTVDPVTKQEIRTIRADITTDEEVVKQVLDLLVIEFKQREGKEPSTEEIYRLKRQAADTVAREKSHDLERALRIMVATAMNYKHKARVEMPIKVAASVVAGAQEAERMPDGTPKIKSRGEGIQFKSESESYKNQKEALDYFMKVFYGIGNEDSLGRFGKTLDSEGKKKVDTIDELLAKNEQLLKEKKISQEEYERDKAVLEAQKEKLYKTVKGSRVVRGIMKFFQVRGLGWNIRSGFANLGFGVIANYTTAADGRFYTSAEMNKAYGMLLSSVLNNQSFETFDTPTAKKIRELSKKIGLDNIVIDFYKTSKKKGGNVILKKLSPFRIMQTTEYMNTSSVMIAMMLHEQVNGKSVWEQYNAEGEWVGEGPEPDMAAKIVQIVKMNHGNYNPDSPIKMDDHVLKQTLGQFRRWMYESFAQRFEREKPDTILGITRKGRYRSGVLGLAWAPTKEGVDMGVGQRILFSLGQVAWKWVTLGQGKSSYDKYFNETDAANLRRNLAEVNMLIILSMFTALLRYAVDGDDLDDWKKATFYQLINSFNRLEKDITMYIDPRDLEFILRKPVPIMGLVVDTYEWFDALGRWMQDDDIIKTGSWAGYSRLMKETNQLIPFGSEIYKNISAGKVIF